MRPQILKPLRLGKILMLLSWKSCFLKGSTVLSPSLPLSECGNYSNQLLWDTSRKVISTYQKNSYIFYSCTVLTGFGKLEDMYVCYGNRLCRWSCCRCLHPHPLLYLRQNYNSFHQVFSSWHSPECGCFHISWIFSTIGGKQKKMIAYFS